MSIGFIEGVDVQIVMVVYFRVLCRFCAVFLYTLILVILYILKASVV